MKIREMIIEDIPRVMVIEHENFVAPWTEANFSYELNDNPFARCFVVEIENTIVAFVDYWITFETCQVNQIAVKDEFKNKGIGSALIKHLFTRALVECLDLITLEVRTHNLKAIEFYKKHGFEVALTKEKYYQNGDDALYMIRRVGELNGKDYSCN